MQQLDSAAEALLIPPQLIALFIFQSIQLQMCGCCSFNRPTCVTCSAVAKCYSGDSFRRAIPCITETKFKYQILPIHFSLYSYERVCSPVFITGKGDLSSQTDGSCKKVWIWYKCRDGNPLRVSSSSWHSLSWCV